MRTAVITDPARLCGSVGLFCWGTFLLFFVSAWPVPLWAIGLWVLWKGAGGVLASTAGRGGLPVGWIVFVSALHLLAGSVLALADIDERAVIGFGVIGLALPLWIAIATTLRLRAVATELDRPEIRWRWTAHLLLYALLLGFVLIGGTYAFVTGQPQIGGASSASAQLQPAARVTLLLGVLALLTATLTVFCQAPIRTGDAVRRM